MKKKLLSILVLIICFFGYTYAQSYLQDAKLLVLFKELYETNQVKEYARIDFSKPEELAKLAGLVIERKRSVGYTPAQSAGDGSGAVGAGAFSSGAVDNSQVTAGQPAGSDEFKDLLVKQVEEEIQFYIEFAEAGYSPFDDRKLKEGLEDFPKSFDYLSSTIEVLTSSDGTGFFTAAAGIGSLVGISQAEIMKGIAEWSLNRAQEELMQSFLRGWLDQLRNDSILLTFFPNTLNMLATSDLTTIYTDGDTWKETFRQDFNEIPEKIPDLVEIILRRAGNPVEETVKYEIISGLELMADLFGELGKGKKPDEILLFLGEEAFIKASRDSVYKTKMNRSMTGLNVFLTSLNSGHGETSQYVTPMEILSLSEEQLKSFWCLMYLRERGKIKIAFDRNTENEEYALYSFVLKNIETFKIKTAKVAEDFNGILNLLKTAENTKEFSAGQFHNYVRLLFDLTEDGLDIIGELSDTRHITEEIRQFRNRYLPVFYYVAQIEEGIGTRSYGKVALNTLNVLIWILDSTVTDQTFREEDIGRLVRVVRIIERIEKLDSIVNNEEWNRIRKELSKNIEKLETSLPETSKILTEKLKNVKKKKKKDSVLTKEEVMQHIRNEFTYTTGEREIIRKEVIAGIRTSIEALNKYARLMAGIILAEDSDDIKNALESAAMKTGGYLVKQKSQFSASVTFYPGIEGGWEKLNQKGQTLPGEVTEKTTSSFKGNTWMGPTLPIGVELAIGTNWKPVSSIGLFLQVLDLGAVMNYSLTNKADSVSALPEIGFQQVLSPGSYLTFHILNTPVTVGTGISYSPKLREINNGTADIRLNALQVGFFVAVDLNVFPIYTSRKKYALGSRSMRQAYEK